MHNMTPVAAERLKVRDKTRRTLAKNAIWDTNMHADATEYLLLRVTGKKCQPSDRENCNIFQK